MNTVDEQIEILQAWKSGKRVEFRHGPAAKWAEVPPHDGIPSDLRCLDFCGVMEYRLKPTEPTLRPWKPEEAVGKWIRLKNYPGKLCATAVLGVYTDGVCLCELGFRRYPDLLTSFEQLDGSPCGVPLSADA